MFLVDQGKATPKKEKREQGPADQTAFSLK
jgi:hypothetical protein